MAVGVASACSSDPTAEQAALAFAIPFQDLSFGEVDDLAAPGAITEIIDPWDSVAVAQPDGQVIVFDRKDPNIGCRLGLASDHADSDAVSIHPDAAFFDPCHGRQYDRAGRPLHDPDDNPMRPLPTYVDDGVVYWDRSDLRDAFVAEIEELDRNDDLRRDEPDDGVDPAEIQDGEPAPFGH